MDLDPNILIYFLQYFKLHPFKLKIHPFWIREVSATLVDHDQLFRVCPFNRVIGPCSFLSWVALGPMDMSSCLRTAEVIAWTFNNTYYWENLSAFDTDIGISTIIYEYRKETVHNDYSLIFI